MKINTRVIWREDKHGNEGWCIKRIPVFDVSSAKGLAHDILEHSRNDKGTYTEEVSAYGAIAAWRIDYTDNLYPGKSLHSKAIDLGKELAQTILYDYWIKFEDACFNQLPKNKLLDNEYIHLITHAALAEFIEEVNRVTENSAVIDPFKLLNWLECWLSNGYIRASKIINQMGYQPGDLWNVVHDQIETYMFNQDYVQGTEVSVQINTDRCWCEIVPIRFKYQFQ
jgi:hypothetical protein